MAEFLVSKGTSDYEATGTDLRHQMSASGLENAPFGDLATWALKAVAAPVLSDTRTSFQLHAPLEVAARILLWPNLTETARPLARFQLFSTARLYVDSVLASGEVSPPVQAATLQTAANNHDVASTSDALARLASENSAEQLVQRLSSTALTSTHGAGHLPIFLAQILEMPTQFQDVAASSIAGVGAELARQNAIDLSHLSIEVEEVRVPQSVRLRSLERLVVDLGQLERLSSDVFAINDLVRQVLGKASIMHDLGVIRVLSRDTRCSTVLFRTMCRMAAFSMLAESDEYARLGWTHCLTLPLASWRLAETTEETLEALVAALIYFSAFRCAYATRNISSEMVSAKLDELRGSTSAQSGYRFTEENHFRWLASQASIRADAHCAKYVAGCKMAADLDPDASALYMAAAERLVQLWIEEIPETRIEETLITGRE